MTLEVRPPETPALRASDVIEAIDSLRESSMRPLEMQRVASVLTDAIASLRGACSPARVKLGEALSRASGFSGNLIALSLDALLAPFDRESIFKLAREPKRRGIVVGFVLAGNVAGAGIHEVVRALCAGTGVAIKTASSEPIFFSAFADAIASIDLDVGARIRVFNWPRTREDLTAVLLNGADLVAVYGDDETVERFRADPKVAAFGSRVSGAILALDELETSSIDAIARGVARDATLFEQLGCLSLHHVVAISRDEARAREFSRAVGFALDTIRHQAPPCSRPSREDAGAIRRVREVARWRRIGGEDVELFEGDRLAWSVIYDPTASFTVSPCFRTLTISHAASLEGAASILEPAKRFIEAIAIAGPGEFEPQLRALARSMGATHICAPGAMQSPPVDWAHGGGLFARALKVPPEK